MIKKMFHGVPTDWRHVLLEKKARKLLADILIELEDLDQNTITPPLTDIFNFAKFPFVDTKIVAIGQDSYPGAGQAHGIAFSTLDKKCPKSLDNIFKCLIKSDLIEKKPTTYDLTSWCKQGMILFNCALTTEIGKPNEHAELWKEYTDRIIYNISKYHTKKLIWCLWGGFAKDKKSLIDEDKHTILEYVHPVARPPFDFTNCNHFNIIKKKYPDFYFSLSENKNHEEVKIDNKDSKDSPDSQDTIIWSTDGSCPSNGKTKAKGAWGCYCHSGCELAKQDFGEPLKAVKIEQQTKEKDPKTGKSKWVTIVTKTKPTNIRSEGLALINVMHLIKKHKIVGHHQIYSDSKFWIKDMLENYIPKWVERGDDWSKHANPDLTEQFWNLVQEVRTNYGQLEFIFCNAWHDYPNGGRRPAKGGPMINNKSQLAYDLNKAAERAAQKRLRDCESDSDSD